MPMPTVATMSRAADLIAGVAAFCKQASKTDVAKVADAMQYCFDDVPYMEFGQGFNEHVRTTADQDLCIPWRRALEGAWADKLGYAEAELEKQKQLARLRLEEISGLKAQLVGLGASVVRYKEESERLGQENDALREQLGTALEYKEQTRPVIEALTRIKAFFNDKG